MNTVRKIAILFIGIAFCCSTALFAGNKPLELVSTNPADNSTGVPLDSIITLAFSNNVVNFSVSEANCECFELKTVSGSTVPVEIVMADDQVEPEKKREIIIKPVDQFHAETEYELIISSSLQGKNGKTLGSDQIIRFTTGL